MTVFDEKLSADEYSDMEFEEFLEFMVRISYVTPYLQNNSSQVAGTSSNSTQDHLKNNQTIPIKLKVAARI